ncbi:hypothetical protein D3C87_367800 [compost metagenome]
MKTNFINCLCIAATLSFSSAFQSYGQQLEQHDDSEFANAHVTGVGSSTVVYHLDTPLATNVLAELENYLESMNAITQVDIKGSDISIQFKEPTNHKMIYPFIQRMEMLYINKNTKSR